MEPSKLSSVNLNDLSSGQSGKIIRISGGWGLRQRLSQVGLHIGDRILVKKSASFGGPILLTIHDADIALSRGMAAHILLEPASVS